VVTPPCDDDVINGTVLALGLVLVLELRLDGGCLLARGTYGVYVVCKVVGGCRGGGRIGPARATGLRPALDVVGRTGPVKLADIGLFGDDNAAGRLVKEEVGEEVVEDGAVEGVGEARPGGTTSG
jgi:hypothetical protein